MAENSSFIIVIGTSAGGLEALSTLISDLPANLPAPVLVVQHLSPITTGKTMVQVLSRTTNLTCKIAEHDEPLAKGTVYLAPPDHHLVVKDHKIALTHGPHENRWRPSIDMLFRSVAAEHNSRAIGVILTGLLDDGTAGMKAIKRSGGTTIIQDPADARYPDMPLSVKQNVDIDHVVKLSEMAVLLNRLVTGPLPAEAPVPDDIQREAEISIRTVLGIESTGSLGPSSYLTCPDCGGVLTETEGPELLHYRCHTGHSYTPDSLLTSQKEEFKSTLWVALRMLEERRHLLMLTAVKYRDKDKSYNSKLLEERAQETAVHIQRLRDLLLSFTNGGGDVQPGLALGSG